jgi:glycosyltransferase involved in cell wall biosynthesis
MKIAIVHDDLMRRGGAEQVARCFHYAFPDAPIFTLCYSPEDTYPDFKFCDVRTSWYQRLVKDEHQMKKLFFPFGVMAMKQLDVTDYEVVLISSTYCAKYVKVSPNAIVINYCHQPFRLAWFPESYTEYLYTRGLKRMVMRAMIVGLKRIDFQAAQRTDYFIANTAETSQKIKEKYGFKKHIPVLYPPVAADNFYVSDKIQDYYLMVTRLEYYKRVDLAIKAFNQLGYKLIIVGRGTKEAELKSIANKNITFESGLSKSKLKELYAGCKALVFPQHEDFGITPLEANSSGRPVIAYGQGGVLNTMIPFTNDPEKSTAIFFEAQEQESLMQAVQTMEKIYLNFNPEFIRQNALKFDEHNFISAVRNLVWDKYRGRATKNKKLEAVINF